LWRTARGLHRKLTPASLRFLLGFVKEGLHLRRVFKEWPVDVLHSGDLGAEPFIIAAKLAGVPRLTGALACLPRQDGLRCGLTYSLLEILCLRCIDDMAAVSQNGKASWVERARLNPRKVRVIYNGIELAGVDGGKPSSRRVRKEIGIPLDAKVIGVAARLVPIKGHSYLIAAFPEVLKAVPSAHIVLAGDGPSRRDLEEQAARLGISERVKFLGHRSDIMRVIQAYDVIALPSLSESMPFSLLEGMSYGKPALVSGVGGMPELVEDSVSGYVVPPRDACAIARALIKLLRNPKKRARMGRAALERVRSRFTAKRMVSETLALMLGNEREGRTSERHDDGEQNAAV